jgi:hypothetical protein
VWKPLVLPKLFVLLGQVMSYGAAYFDKVSRSSSIDTTQHAQEQKKAKRGKEGGLGASPGCKNSTRKHAEEGQAERSGEGGFGGLPRLRQPNSLTH